MVNDCLIRVFYCMKVLKYLNIEWAYPGLNEFRKARIHCTFHHIHIAINNIFTHTHMSSNKCQAITLLCIFVACVCAC